MASLLAPLTERADAAPGEAGEAADPRRRRLDVAAAVAVGLSLLVWAGPVTHGTGGRAPWTLALGLLCLVPALLVARPWRAMRAREVAVAMAPAVAAVVVCLTAPTGFDGLDEAAALAYCGGLYVVVRGWAVDQARRRLVLVALSLVGLEQFTQAYLPWWGRGSASSIMVGTFYWHNQFAAFMLGTGLVAAVMAVRGTGLVRRVGWLTAPWCLVALLFAGSRGVLAAFAVCWLLVVVVSLVDRRGRVASLVLVAVTLGLASVLASPLLMEDAGWFGSTLEARVADQGHSGNGRARVEFWRAAVQVGAQRPLTGAGFDSYGSVGATYMPVTSGLSSYAHNGYLQAFSDGGILLLLAVTTATALPLWGAARALARRRRGDEVVSVAVPVAMLALVLHSGVDFDWAYPSLVALFAVLAALVPAYAAQGVVRPARGHRGTRTAVILALVLVVLGVPAALRATALDAPDAEVPPWAQPVADVVPLREPLDWLPSASLCRAELSSQLRTVRQHGLACTAALGRIDPGLELRRSVAQVRNGRVETGRRSAEEVVGTYADRRPMLRLTYAEVLQAAGAQDEALAELLSLQADLAAADLPVQAKVVQRVLDERGGQAG